MRVLMVCVIGAGDLGACDKKMKHGLRRFCSQPDIMPGKTVFTGCSERFPANIAWRRKSSSNGYVRILSMPMTRLALLTRLGRIFLHAKQGDLKDLREIPQRMIKIE
jgi:hypothetical protein